MKMKKTAIVLAVLTASLFAVSCQKENNPEAIGFTPMTISAVSEGIGTATKTEMIYKYDIAWSANDKIYVTDGTANDTFTLSDGAGTTKGTFTQDGKVTFNNEVQAYYPSTLVQEDGSLVWPATLTNNQTVPMYSTKTVSGNVETFNFSSLGSVFQLIFSTESKDVVLQSIELKADEAMSGVFTISNGKAVMPTEGDKPGIKLDLGETGVALGVAAKKFNIAIPAGEYNNLTIILTAKDGRECEIKAKNAQTIAYNTVSTLTLSKAFEGGPITPVDPIDVETALPGLFSIGAGEQIRFSKGNLRYNTVTGKWSFYDEQYYCGLSSYEYGHNTEISLFSWGYGNWSIIPDTEDYQEVNFTDWGSPLGDWRTLTIAEWQYLLGTSTKRDGRFEIGVTVCGYPNCLVIAPDEWDIINDPLQQTYSISEWESAEAAGLVCLPPAGYRNKDYVNQVGADGAGYYWSSTDYEDEVACAMYFFADASGKYFDTDWTTDKYGGISVRLVTEVAAE